MSFAYLLSCSSKNTGFFTFESFLGLYSSIVCQLVSLRSTLVAIFSLNSSNFIEPFGLTIDILVDSSFDCRVSYSGDLSLVSTYFKYWCPKSELKSCALWGFGLLDLNLSKLLKFDSIVPRNVFMNVALVYWSSDSFGKSLTRFVDCWRSKSKCWKVFLQLCWSRTVRGRFVSGDRVCDRMHLTGGYLPTLLSSML